MYTESLTSGVDRSRPPQSDGTGDKSTSLPQHTQADNQCQ